MGRRARYLLRFGSRSGYDSTSCNVGYQWVIKNQPSLNKLAILDITSDATRNGVNVTALIPASAVDTLPSALTSENELTVVLINAHGKEIGRATKKVTVLTEENAHLFSKDD